MSKIRPTSRYCVGDTVGPALEDRDRLRLPVPVHVGGCGALVSRAGGALGGPARGHLSHPAPVGGRGCGDPVRGRAGVAGRAALHAVRPPPHRAAAALRARGLLASAAPRAPLRRGPLRLVPLLLAARSLAGAAAAPPRAAGRGLVRAVDARLLDRVPRPGGWSHRAPGAATLREDPGPQLHVLTPARRAARGRGPPRAPDHADRACTAGRAPRNPPAPRRRRWPSTPAATSRRSASPCSPT